MDKQATIEQVREAVAKAIPTNCTVCQIVSGKHPPDCASPCSLQLLRADQILFLQVGNLTIKELTERKIREE